MDYVDNVISVDSVYLVDDVDTVYFVDAEDSVESLDSAYAVDPEMLQEAGGMSKSLPFKNVIRVSPVAFQFR